LAVGNYLNSGFRGGAYGFKLDALLKVIIDPKKKKKKKKNKIKNKKKKKKIVNKINNKIK